MNYELLSARLPVAIKGGGTEDGSEKVRSIIACTIKNTGMAIKRLRRFQ